MFRLYTYGIQKDVRKLGSPDRRRKPLIPSSEIFANMAFLLFLGVSSAIGLGGYIIYRWFGGNQNRHTDGGQDDIDGYRNEQVQYLVTDVITGRVNTELIENLKSKIQKYGDRAAVEYIGITSGSDGPVSDGP